MLKDLGLVGCLLLACCATQSPASIHYQDALAAQISLTRSIQIQLIRLGYFHDLANGIYGESTQNAICNFQDANGIRIDTTRSHALFATLSASTPVVAWQ
jgi:peptidoglycan hydrolase-like protein with peptidoglycan-binding domain